MHAYYPNPTRMCFGTSLANLFLEFGDAPLARRVFENYTLNPLVCSDGGVNPYITPFLVRSLTQEGYSARLFVEEVNLRLLLLAISNPGLSIEKRDLTRLITDEIDHGNIQPRKQLRGKTRHARIDFTGFGESSHAYVNLDGTFCVNDGQLVKLKFNRNLTFAYLQVQKTNN